MGWKPFEGRNTGEGCQKLCEQGNGGISFGPWESVIQSIPDIRGVRAVANLLRLHGAKDDAEKEAGVAKTNASSLPIRVLSRSIIIFRIPKDSIHLLPTTHHAADLSYEVAGVAVSLTGSGVGSSSAWMKPLSIAPFIYNNLLPIHLTGRGRRRVRMTYIESFVY
ncbi:MAG: hypothetical protein II818_02780 [Aeriscardovia sp.]|nr:hypothetical protein [Aeriscardovia sp.]